LSLELWLQVCYSVHIEIVAHLQRERHKPMYVREIKYDRETRDFAMYLDGELVGFARNYHEAEIELDRLVFELLSGQYFRDAA
jgi:hypothetical protein